MMAEKGEQIMASALFFYVGNLGSSTRHIHSFRVSVIYKFIFFFLSVCVCVCYVCTTTLTTTQELELRIETQKQTLQSRDESIKKLLEMLQNKGMGEFTCTWLFSFIIIFWGSRSFFKKSLLIIIFFWGGLNNINKNNLVSLSHLSSLCYHTGFLSGGQLIRYQLYFKNLIVIFKIIDLKIWWMRREKPNDVT